MEKLLTDFNKNVNYMNSMFRVDENFDVVYHIFKIGGRQACLYFIDGFLKDEVMQKLLQIFGDIKEADMPKDAYEFLKILPYTEVDKTNDLEKISTSVLSGVPCIIIDGYEEAVFIDCRTYPARSVSEPEKDKVMRGSKDGFVETLVFNTALIRRRIRSNDLTMKYMQAGKTSKTDIVLCYMDSRVNKKFLNEMVEKIENLNVDSLTMNQESLAECLIGRTWWNPFPKFKYSERPDTAAACVLEGNIIILVDNSPSAMILPTTVFDVIEEADDYYFPPVTGTYLRLSRVIINILALILTPLFVLFMKYPEYIPNGFEFIVLKEPSNISIVWQFLILEFAIDGLRLASISTPNMLSTPLSVMAAIIFGEFTVKSGWFNAEALLYMSFVALASYTQASFELSYALKFMRLILLIATSVFGIYGFVGGIIFTLLLIIFNRTMDHRSYIYPIFPFNAKKLLRRFFRVSLPESEKQ